jgi:hypothetical protein
LFCPLVYNGFGIPWTRIRIHWIALALPGHVIAVPAANLTYSRRPVFGLSI